MTVDLRRPPAEGSIATWQDLCQPCVPACSSPALRPGPFLPSLASIVLFQHHFRRCSSAHHFLAQRASLPDEVGLASHLTNDWFFSLSLFSRERSEPLDSALSRLILSEDVVYSENGGPLTIDLRGFLSSSITFHFPITDFVIE